MTASLPEDVQQVFRRFVTTEYTTIDAQGQPITWPVTPYYSPGAPQVDITTGLGYPKKAEDARRNRRVALLFSDPTGSGMHSPPAVLVQGTAIVDDEDLEANRERYSRESREKIPGARDLHLPKQLQRMLTWYYLRVYVHVRPERVFAWPGRDFGQEPQLYGSHMEEVRSHHSEEPVVAPADLVGGSTPWDERLNQLGRRYSSAVLSVVAPDGFPMSARVDIEPDEPAGRIRIPAAPVGVPLAPGRACLTAHEHGPDFGWHVNFQVRGNLLPDDRGWALIPRRLVGGLDRPPGSVLARARLNARNILRFRRIAKKELAERRRRTAAPG